MRSDVPVPATKPISAFLSTALTAGFCFVCFAAEAGAQKPSGWDASVDKPAAPPATKTPAPEKPAAAIRPTAEPSAAPQPATPLAAQTIAFGDWLLACTPAGGKQLCDLSQTVRDAQNRRIIQITARRTGPAAYLEIIVPVGVSIPYGVSIDVSGNVKFPAALADCSPSDCRAVLALDGNALQTLKTATTVAVTFQDSKSGKVISISGSPKGFDQGIAVLLAAS